MTMKALSDTAKEELPVRKSLYDLEEQNYQSLNGFTVKSNLNDSIFTYNLVTEYAKIDMDAINKLNEQEEQIAINLKYNQNIDSVKSYYENLGLKCTK